jgi:hypothetical protein
MANLKKVGRLSSKSPLSTLMEKKGKEWKVIFINPSASDQNKKNLFMFFTPPGNFIAANYTGQ